MNAEGTVLEETPEVESEVELREGQIPFDIWKKHPQILPGFGAGKRKNKFPAGTSSAKRRVYSVTCHICWVGPMKVKGGNFVRDDHEDETIRVRHSSEEVCKAVKRMRDEQNKARKAVVEHAQEVKKEAIAAPKIWTPGSKR